jgi:short-subunit dehydrogenase
VELNGAVAVVTGASAGIGWSTAVALAREGASVVVAARRLERLEGLAREVDKRGGTAHPVACDVNRLQDLERLREETERAFGPADVLVNNAGLPGGGPFNTVRPEQIEQIVRTNLLAVILGTRVFLPAMLERGRGHVVNVASLAGRYATPGAAVYSATKHGVVAFSESLYHEVHSLGVLVTAVNPGFVTTEGFPQRDKPGWMVMRPERVAEAIVDAVRRDIAPELSIPRWAASFQAFRVLTPPLYRWGLRRATRQIRPTRAR